MADEIFSPVKRLIESRFATQWALVGGGLPVEYEAVPFDAPNDGKYVRLTIRFASSTPLTIGRVRTEKQPGLAYVNIFWPKKEGTKPVDELVDKVAKIFRWYRIHSGGVSLSFKTPDNRAQEVGEFMTAVVVTEFDSRITIDTQTI